MAATHLREEQKKEKMDKTAAARPSPHKPDPQATAGSKTSLGAESVRDGRPATDDSTVEAIDEGGPGPADE